MKNFLSTDFLKAGAAWLILLGGVGLYLIGFFLLDAESIWRQIVIKVGDALVIGIVLRFMTDAARFIGIFEEDLQKIIWGEKFIGERKKLYPLWENLTNALFKKKFPAIRKDLLKTLHEYLPKNAVAYYDDYNTNITLEWVDDGHQIIKETREVAFDLMASTSGEIIHQLRTRTRTDRGPGFSNTITTITVNGQAAELGAVVEEDGENEICHTQPLTLQGRTKYRIKYTRVKTYDFEKDYHVAFKAQYIVHDLKVSLFLPDDLCAAFISRGVLGKFEDFGNVNNRIGKQYKGIILPYQGYIFALKRRPLE